MSDPMSKTFEIYGELGFDIDINVVETDVKTGKEFKRTFSHAKNDGTGVILTLLKESNEASLETLPTPPRRNKKPFIWRFFNGIKQYFRCFAQFNRPSNSWKHSESSAAAPLEVWKYLSKEETDKLLKNAKENHVSANSLMIYYLNQTLKPYLHQHSYPNTWTIPVSLYEEYDLNHIQGNKTSIMEASITYDMSLKKVNQLIKKEIDQESYIGAILASTVTLLFGKKITKKVLQDTVVKKDKVGAFSNLGVWTSLSGKITEKKRWAICPPVLPAQPFACLVITVDGKLSAMIKFDPVLNLSESEGRKILDDWLNFCLEEHQ